MKKFHVALAVVGLFAGMASGLLRGADRVDWLGYVLLLVALGGVMFGLLRLWSSAVSFFGAIALLGVSLAVSGAHAQPLWMSAFGETRTDCQVVDKQVVRGDRSASSHLSQVRCGERTVWYEPYQTMSEYIGDVGERTSLVFDRTGLMNPVRPSDVTAAGAWTLPGVALLGLLFIAFAAAHPAAEARKPKVERGFL